MNIQVMNVNEGGWLKEGGDTCWVSLYSGTQVFGNCEGDFLGATPNWHPCLPSSSEHVNDKKGFLLLFCPNTLKRALQPCKP